MSLKAFHIVFIVASILLAFGFGAWLLNNYFTAEARQLSDLVLGVCSIVFGFGLIGYECYFLKKTRHISYL